MGLARFVEFHRVPEQDTQARPPRFALMLARAADGVVLVLNPWRKVWELPGGLIDPGEAPRQAAERELFEEAGCRPRDTEWLGLVEVDDGATHFGAVYRCEVDEVPAEFANEETVALGRWRPDAAPEPLGPSDAALLRIFA